MQSLRKSHTRAVEAGFEVLLTADRMMYRQHDFSRLPLAVVVTPGNRLSILNDLRDAIAAAVEQATPGETIVFLKKKKII